MSVQSLLTRSISALHAPRCDEVEPIGTESGEIMGASNNRLFACFQPRQNASRFGCLQHLCQGARLPLSGALQPRSPPLVRSHEGILGPQPIEYLGYQQDFKRRQLLLTEVGENVQELIGWVLARQPRGRTP